MITASFSAMWPLNVAYFRGLSNWRRHFSLRKRM